MGVSFRVFALKSDESLERISNARFNRVVFHKTDNLPDFAGTRLRYAFVIVEVDARRVLKIIRIDYLILPLNDSGGIDQAEWNRNLKLSMELFYSDLHSNNQADGNVINARGVFAEKELDAFFRWKPSAEIEQKIRDMIFSKRPITPSPRKHTLSIVK